jgi:class 3 adenylate cyclase
MELSIEVKDLLSNTTQFYSFDKKYITIGRNDSKDIVLQNKYISDFHASITQKWDVVYIKDEHSSNGTEIYSNYRWNALGDRSQKVKVPLQIKLAEAVVITIQSGDSQVVSLPEVENDSSIMVLDICNSTNQALNNEQIAFHLKQRLNNIAKPILYDSPILFYKNTGDGFLATFPKATQAVNTAIEILKVLQMRNKRSTNPPINVRIGLHHGRTYLIDPATEDIHGIDINITFRIEGLRRNGFNRMKQDIGIQNRILASKDFYLQYQKQTRRKKKIFDLCGSAKLKSIKEKMQIYRVNWED